MSETDPEVKFWQALGKRYSQVFSAANLVEYGLPALALVVTIGADVWVVFSYNIFSVAGLAINNALIAIGVVLLVGWLMYTTRFYQFFWGYSGHRRRFEQRIAEISEDALPRGVAADQAVGAYIYRVYWKLAKEEDRKNSLRLHVNWVFLVHITNVFVFAFLFLIGSSVYAVFVSQISAVQLASDTSFIILIVVYILSLLYVRRAALKNLDRSNGNIIDQVNRYRSKIEKDLPDNLADILKPL